MSCVFTSNNSSAGSAGPQGPTLQVRWKTSLANTLQIRAASQSSLEGATLLLQSIS